MAYVVVARWRAKEGCEDRLAQVIAELTPLSRAEPGSLFYQANRSVDDPRLFLFYEQYVDEDAYLAHGASDHFKRLGHDYAIPELLEDRQREFFTTFYDDRGGFAG
jgi:quinol monooxygenase YgiN